MMLIISTIFILLQTKFLTSIQNMKCNTVRYFSLYPFLIFSFSLVQSQWLHFFAIISGSNCKSGDHVIVTEVACIFSFGIAVAEFVSAPLFLPQFLLYFLRTLRDQFHLRSIDAHAETTLLTLVFLMCYLVQMMQLKILFRHILSFNSRNFSLCNGLKTLNAETTPLERHGQDGQLRVML